MATVYHKYIPKAPKPPTKEQKDTEKRRSAKLEADHDWIRERTAAAAVKRRGEEMRQAVERGQLISKEVACRQVATILAALREQLLALPGQRAQELARDFGVDEFKTRQALDQRMRAALQELSNLPAILTQQAQRNGDVAAG
jgi:hypothetical protein